MNKLKGIGPAVIARVLFLLVALVNQGLAAYGHSPIDLVVSEDTFADSISVIFTALAGIIAGWKNNSFTTAAKKADVVLKDHKAVKKIVKTNREGDFK